MKSQGGHEARSRAHTEVLDIRAMAAAPGEFPVGAVVAGRYRVDAFVAAGGMGRVYRAHDLTLDVPLALKTIRPEIAASPLSLRRFKQEVLLARSIAHPHVCRIFELGHDKVTGAYFLTMEFLPGDTLAARIDESGPVEEAEALELARQMAEALDAAHRAGIVHRDFKSPNVMLAPGDGGACAVITDFGLAVSVGEEEGSSDDASRAHDPDGADPDITGTPKVADDASSSRGSAVDESSPSRKISEGSDLQPTGALGDAETLDLRRSQVGRMVGTPAYMSPEQVRGQSAGPASDLYALGIVLFEMRTGQLPFRGHSPMDVARARLENPPPSPRSLGDVSQKWEDAIVRLLARDPGDRFQTARDAVLALEGAGHGGPAVRHSLPAERDAFVGRRRELQTLAAHLESTGTRSGRLVTLQGAGGSGKTRLAQKYGWNSLLHWTGGVWFCDLSEARDELGIASEVSRVLGHSLDPRDPIAGLGRKIAQLGRALVVLDNFEQVVSHAAATVERWLAQTTEARFLVTSRGRLQLPGEVTCALDSLDPATRGVELFEVRAWGHRPGFLVDPSNHGQIREIVEELDGLPLAIELAASRMRMLNPEQLRAGLADRFRLLSGGKRGRHETLEATLDWSWELLEPWEQAATAQASLFEGGFSLEAAEAVIELAVFDQAPSVLDALQSLVDKSWLRPNAVDGSPRFSMYATSQEYAGKKLAVDPLFMRSARERHLRYFVSMAETAEADLEGRNAEVWFHRLEIEDANLRAAIRYGATSGQPEGKGEGEVGVDSGAAAAEDAGIEDRLHSSMRLACALVRYLQRRGRYAEARVLFEDGVRRRDELPRQLRARVLIASGVLAFRNADYEVATERSTEASALFAELGDVSGYGTAQLNLGNLAMALGDLDLAKRRFETASAAFEAINQRWRLCAAKQNLGALAFFASEYESADEHYRKSLGLARELGDRDQCAILLMSLGLVDFRRKDLDSAEARMSECFAEMRALRNEWGAAAACLNLSLIKLDQGDEVQTERHVREALERCSSLEDHQITIASLEAAASLAALRRDDVRAVRLFTCVDRLREEIGLHRMEVETSDVVETLRSLRDRLGEDIFDRESACGNSLSVEDAVAEALPPKDARG